MKVLHIVGKSQFGGATFPILRLAQLAQSMGWEVEVLTTATRFTNILAQHQINTVPLDVIWREIRIIEDLKGLYQLYLFLKNSDYTIVHTHTSKAGFVGRLAAKLAGIPVIIHTVHGFSFHEESSQLSLRIYATLEKLAAQWCDYLVLLTEFHRQWALNLGIGNPQKNVVIPNWIQPERLQPKPLFLPSEYRRSLDIQPEDCLLLVAGRLAPQKGHQYLIQALNLLQEKSTQSFKLIIAGEGELELSLQQLVKDLQLEKKVLFIGFCETMAELLAISDLIVLPSLWEGLSISLLEAMAVGKPIITTTIGSNLEVLKNRKNALLVAVKNPEALASAILELVNNPSLAHTLSKQAKTTFYHHYTQEIHLSSYKELYLKAIQSKT